MAKFKPWLKMWVEWLDDLKMLDLTLAEQGAWWRVVTLAQKCAAGGALLKDNGAPLSPDEITSTLRIKTKADQRVFDTMIQKMTDQGSLHWNPGASGRALVVTNLAGRQAKTPSETPEAVRDRVRRYRERKAVVTEKPLPPLTTPLLEEGDVEEEEESNGEKSVTSDPIIAEISTLYEENCGLITPILVQDFAEFCENYHGPIEWIRDAFDEAVKRNKRHWKYIEAILDRWQREGRGKKEDKDGTHRQGDRETPADRLRKSAE